MVVFTAIISSAPPAPRVSSPSELGALFGKQRQKKEVGGIGSYFPILALIYVNCPRILWSVQACGSNIVLLEEARTTSPLALQNTPTISPRLPLALEEYLGSFLSIH